VPATDSIPLLLAADFWQVVFGLIVFILYSIGQWVSAKEQAKKKPPKPRRPRRPQPAEEQRHFGEQEPEMLVAGQDNQEDALRSEVEDFLRRAQGEPPRQKRPARLKPKPLPVELVPVESAQPATSLRREGVAEHVASHLSSRQMIEHAQRLGDEVGQADERLELRLHHKFDRQLGSFKHEKEPTSPKEKKRSAAEEVVELLRKPGGMRQLIIAQEILRRPEW